MTGSPRFWPSVTATVATHLNEVLDVPVRWAVPNPRPDAFITITRIGSVTDEPWIDGAAVQFAVYSGEPGDSPAAADALAYTLRAAVEAMPGQCPPVAKARVTGIAASPDPLSGAPRVLVGAQIWVKPAAA